MTLRTLFVDFLRLSAIGAFIGVVLMIAVACGA